MRQLGRFASSVLSMFILAGVVIAFAVTGCGNDDSLPTSSEEAIGDPVFLENPVPALPLDDDEDDEDDEGSPIFIESDEGGTIRLGRWTLTVPEEATDDDVIITMEDAGTEYLMVDLKPDGLKFDKRVTLQVDLSGLEWEPFEDWTMWWFRENHESWKDMGGSFDPETGVLTVYIKHFSTWGPGRAGW